MPSRYYLRNQQRQGQQGPGLIPAIADMFGKGPQSYQPRYSISPEGAITNTAKPNWIQRMSGVGGIDPEFQQAVALERYKRANEMAEVKAKAELETTKLAKQAVIAELAKYGMVPTEQVIAKVNQVFDQAAPELAAMVLEAAKQGNLAQVAKSLAERSGSQVTNLQNQFKSTPEYQQKWQGSELEGLRSNELANKGKEASTGLDIQKALSEGTNREVALAGNARAEALNPLNIDLAKANVGLKQRELSAPQFPTPGIMLTPQNAIASYEQPEASFSIGGGAPITTGSKRPVDVSKLNLLMQSSPDPGMPNPTQQQGLVPNLQDSGVSPVLSIEELIRRRQNRF